MIPIGIHMGGVGFGVGCGNTGPSSVAGFCVITMAPGPHSKPLASMGGDAKETLRADDREDVDDAGEAGAFGEALGEALGEGRARGPSWSASKLWTALVIALAID
jgi:hypothetical protein|mmetsp:Transcript_34790/g.96055  ORF Transcript_34790/g.96055 Transcript_34790/m.96055 type:complete len:105 (+) Transcript_34790:377-691(+)